MKIKKESENKVEMWNDHIRSKIIYLRLGVNTLQVTRRKLAHSLDSNHTKAAKYSTILETFFYVEMWPPRSSFHGGHYSSLHRHHIKLNSWLLFASIKDLPAYQTQLLITFSPAHIGHRNFANNGWFTEVDL